MKIINKIAVLLKQVPDVRSVGRDIFNEDGSLKRDSLPFICNPSDMKALEMALSLKDRYPDISVVTLSLGPYSAEMILKEALNRGADEAFLITDQAFAGSDTLATSRVLSAALKKISADIVLCGACSIDGGTSQVPGSVAEFLSVPDVFSVLEILEIKDSSLVLKTEDNLLEVNFPSVLSVSDNAPACRYENIRKYIEFHDYVIERWNMDDLELSAEQVGKRGSETVIDKIVLNENIIQKKQVAYSSDRESIDKLIKTICNILH